MPHKLRKIRKLRGSKTAGWGRTGQHRRTSQKGGRKVGRHKHGWSYVLRYEPDYFGKHGFTSHKSLRQKVQVINVGELESLADKLALQNLLEKKEEKVFIDLEQMGYTKLLGMGKIATPMLVKIGSCSESAAKKIEEAGGQILAKPD